MRTNPAFRFLVVLTLLSGILTIAPGPQALAAGDEGALPGRTATIEMLGLGVAPRSRPVISYTCGTETGQVPVQYGTSWTIDLANTADDCEFSISGGSRTRSRHWFVGDGDYSGDYANMILEGEASTITLFDMYDSVFNDTELAATQAFGDILDREPTAAELTLWYDSLVGGVPLERMVASLVESDEYLGRIAPITRLYLSYFLRQPDDGGLSYWLQQNRAGTGLQDISQFFAASAEFELRYGTLDDNEFVDLVYQNLLDRTPDTAGATYWQDALANGTPRGVVMMGFSESPENINKTESSIVVRSLYYGLLGREPDASGGAYWESVHASGAPLDSLIEGFIFSDEYVDRFLIKDAMAGQAQRMADDDQAGQQSSRLPAELPGFGDWSANR